MSSSSHRPPPERRLFCNRTLNLRGIRAVGFDMDYTLVHYHSAQWEERAYVDMRQKLIARGIRADGLAFDHDLVRPGLVLDLTLGNAVKPNRFGFVKQACHGTQNLTIDALREAYSRVLIDLQEPRWVFLNTLFSLSEACLFLQLVDRFDRGELGESIKTYDALYQAVKECLDATHSEGELKAQIIKNPEPYVDLDPDLALALLDLKHAGKKLLLITNSEWSFTYAMMTYTLDRFLPKGQTFRDVFDLIITGARKPRFFESDLPVFRVIDETRDVLQPHVGELTPGQVYFGGHARQVERCFNLKGEDILYVGDHLYADVHVSKNVLRWRTCLITRELENELSALESFKPKQAALTTLMEQKDALEHDYSMARIALQRREAGYGPTSDVSGRALKQEMQAIRQRLTALDQEAGVLAREASELGSKRWGLAMRAGNDKSRLAYQMERYADVYTSRVSNFALVSPFVYLRSPRGSLPHDAGPSGGT